MIRHPTKDEFFWLGFAVVATAGIASISVFFAVAVGIGFMVFGYTRKKKVEAKFIDLTETSP